MDEYEPGLTIQEIDTLFDDLMAFLPKLLEKVLTNNNAGLLSALQEISNRTAEGFGADFDDAVRL